MRTPGVVIGWPRLGRHAIAAGVRAHAGCRACFRPGAVAATLVKPLRVRVTKAVQAVAGHDEVDAAARQDQIFDRHSYPVEVIKAAPPCFLPELPYHAPAHVDGQHVAASLGGRQAQLARAAAEVDHLLTVTDAGCLQDGRLSLTGATGSSRARSVTRWGQERHARTMACSVANRPRLPVVPMPTGTTQHCAAAYLRISPGYAVLDFGAWPGMFRFGKEYAWYQCSPTPPRPAAGIDEPRRPVPRWLNRAGPRGPRSPRGTRGKYARGVSNVTDSARPAAARSSS